MDSTFEKFPNASWEKWTEQKHLNLTQLNVDFGQYLTATEMQIEKGLVSKHRFCQRAQIQMSDPSNVSQLVIHVENSKVSETF